MEPTRALCALSSRAFGQFDCNLLASDRISLALVSLSLLRRSLRPVRLSISTTQTRARDPPAELCANNAAARSTPGAECRVRLQTKCPTRSQSANSRRASRSSSSTPQSWAGQICSSLRVPSARPDGLMGRFGAHTRKGLAPELVSFGARVNEPADIVKHAKEMPTDRQHALCNCSAIWRERDSSARAVCSLSSRGQDRLCVAQNKQLSGARVSVHWAPPRQPERKRVIETQEQSAGTGTCKFQSINRDPC